MSRLKEAFVGKTARLGVTGLAIASIGLSGCGEVQTPSAEAVKAQRTPVTDGVNGVQLVDQNQKAIADAVKKAVDATVTANRIQPLEAENARLRVNPGAGVSGAPAPRAEITPVAAATVAPARVETQQGTETFRFAAPTDFRPESPGGVQNTLLEQSPMNKWFHPMTKIRFQNNAEWVWSYQYYFLNGSTDLELIQHGGEEGRLVFRQETGPSRLVLGVGTLSTFTDSKGVKHNLSGDIRVDSEPNAVASIWFRTHPNVRVRVFDPDSGQPLMLDGKPVEGITSESGDIGFGLCDDQRAVFVADIPFDPKLETFVWKGPHDRVQPDVNWIDIRSCLTPVKQPTTVFTATPTATFTPVSGVK